MKPAITGYRSGDEKEILALFNRTFGRERTPEHWRWENLQNPHGKSLFALLKEGEKIRGHLCLQPRLLQARGEKIAAGQRIGSMLEEGFRSRGFYKKMLEQLQKEAKRKKISFTFSFPNEQAMRALSRSEAAHAFKTQRFVKIYSSMGAAAVLRGRNIFKRAAAGAALWLLRVFTKEDKSVETGNVKEIHRFDSRFDSLWEKAAPSLGAACVRDSQYLNWRYIDSPAGYKVFACEKGEEIAGYIVLRATGKLGHIADILAQDEEQCVPQLLKKSDEYFKEEGCALASFWCLEKRGLENIFKSRGFSKLQNSTTLALLNINSPKKVEEFLRQKENWYITPGDSDYV